MYWAEYKGILFIEGPVPTARSLRAIDTKYDGFGSQLKSLDTIKDQMVARVVAAGGNAVIDFRYGQKSTFWRSLISVDEVFWWAAGTIARVDRAALPPRPA